MRTLELLSELVTFPSVSATSNVEVSKWAEEQLVRLGFRTEWVEYEDRNGIRKACVSGQIGEQNGRGLAYFCHTDVVPVATWDHPASGPWELKQQYDRVYGRGSCDMKGSLACMLAAVEAMGDQTLSSPLTIVCTADEEVGLQGARHLVGNSAIYKDIVARQSRGIIGEPTQLEVVHAHKGGRGIKISARGKAAHSSTNEGINANFAMIPFLSDMHKLCQEIDGNADWTDERFEPPTINLNLGINDHTHAVNITPGQSICTIYFRTMPNIDADGLVQRIKSAAIQHGLEFEMMFSGEPVFSDPNSQFIAELLQLSGTIESHTVSYGTDGSCFSDLDDLAVLGPGSIAQAHKDDEWISLDQLEKGAALFKSLIERWCV